MKEDEKSEQTAPQSKRPTMIELMADEYMTKTKFIPAEQNREYRKKDVPKHIVEKSLELRGKLKALYEELGKAENNEEKKTINAKIGALVEFIVKLESFEGMVEMEDKLNRLISKKSVSQKELADFFEELYELWRSL